MTDNRNDLPTVAVHDSDASILQLLRDLQRAALLHPEAMRGMYRALAAEGRLFAQTAEGAHWKERLLRSRLLERALLVWQTATLWMSEDQTDAATPSALVDALAAAASSRDRDVLLDRLFREIDEGDDDAG